jgi:hypothetical protein
MPEKEVFIQPGDKLVIRVGKETTGRRLPGREVGLPSPRQQALSDMRNLIRAHVREIGFLQSGAAEDKEALTMELGEELPAVLQRLGEHKVTQAEVASEVQRVLRAGQLGAYAAQDALDRATCFMQYLQGSYEEQMQALPKAPPATIRGGSRRTRRG